MKQLVKLRSTNRCQVSIDFCFDGHVLFAIADIVDEDIDRAHLADRLAIGSIAFRGRPHVSHDRPHLASHRPDFAGGSVERFLGAAGQDDVSANFGKG